MKLLNSAGAVKTNFLNAIGFTKEQVEQQERLLQKSSPLNLFGEPNDIADMVVYVGSEYAKFMTGSCLLIDGGSLHGQIQIVD